MIESIKARTKQERDFITVMNVCRKAKVSLVFMRSVIQREMEIENERNPEVERMSDRVEMRAREEEEAHFDQLRSNDFVPLDAPATIKQDLIVRKAKKSAIEEQRAYTINDAVSMAKLSIPTRGRVRKAKKKPKKKSTKARNNRASRAHK